MGTELFIGRQPIYDGRVRIVGYELLFRDADVPRARMSDPDAATLQVLVDAVMELGLDHLVGPHPAHVNVTGALLGTDRLLALPPERVVLEIAADPPPQGSLVTDVDALVARGFRFALDNLTAVEPWRPLLSRVHLVKLDVPVLGPEHMAETLKALAEYDVQVLAAKVETPEVFEGCRGLGIDRFQGHFLCRPQVVRAQRLPATRLGVLRLLAELTHPDTDAARIEALVAQDVGLSYRLLKYINAPYFGLSHQVESMRQAVVLLGLDQVRRWATLIALADLSDKPPALMATALMRARMCEELARAAGHDHPEVFFATGLFSVLDAMMDCTMDEVVASLPLAESLRAALVDRQGAPGRALAVTLAYEEGDWPEVEDSGLDTTAVREAYLAALGWADRTGEALGLTP